MVHHEQKDLHLGEILTYIKDDFEPTPALIEFVNVAVHQWARNSKKRYSNVADNEQIITPWSIYKYMRRLN